MRRSLFGVAAAVLLAGSTMPGSALADPVLVRSGGVGFDPGDPPGYSFTGDDFSIWGLFPAIATSGAFSCAPAPCSPGSLVWLGTVFGGPLRDFDLGYGVATIGGVTYGSATGPPGSGFLFLRGTLTFDAPTLPVPGGDEVARLVAPFLFSGHIAGFGDSPAGVPLFETDLLGQGLATMVLRRDESGVYRFLGVNYQIVDPVPEPASLALVASGLAGAWLRTRRRKQEGRRKKEDRAC